MVNGNISNIKKPRRKSINENICIERKNANAKRGMDWDIEMKKS